MPGTRRLRFRILLFLITSLAAIGGCADEPVRAAAEPADLSAQDVVTVAAPAAPRRNTFVYECDDRGESLRVITRVGPGEIALWLPVQWGGGYFVLGQVRAASGSRYEGDGLMLWVKGEEAMVEAAGELHAGCRLDVPQSIWEHARLSGVLFRGVGNEPGWSIEIRNRRMDLVLDYGDRLLSVDLDAVNASGPSASGGSREIRAFSGDEAVLVEITAGACNDTMSGELFTAAVVAHVGTRLFHGCGRWLSRVETRP